LDKLHDQDNHLSVLLYQQELQNSGTNAEEMIAPKQYGPYARKPPQLRRFQHV
jgi:hypothetical protein